MSMYVVIFLAFLWEKREEAAFQEQELGARGLNDSDLLFRE